MELLVLGNCSPSPRAGGACSGYLVKCGDKKVLLDCGSGSVSKLKKFYSILDLDCIVLTHHHDDHTSDVYPIMDEFYVHKMFGGKNAEPLPIYVPVEPSADFEKISSKYKGFFKIIQLDHTTEIKLGNMNISFATTNHPIFVYTSDTAYSKSIEEFCHNADLLLCEAGLPSFLGRPDDPSHIQTYQIAVMAENAGAKKVLLTHMWPDFDPYEVYLNEVVKSLTRPGTTVQIAEEESIYNI